MTTAERMTRATLNAEKHWTARIRDSVASLRDLQQRLTTARNHEMALRVHKIANNLDWVLANTRQGKPGCRVTDLIVTWDQVREGDLVVHKGRFEVVVKVRDPHPASRLGVQFRGRRGASWVRRDNLTAVRRYIDTSED